VSGDRHASGSSSSAAAANPAHKWFVTVSVMTGTIMAVLDSSIVNVALPTMSGTLGVSIEEITWVVTAYILSSVIIMPITAFLSARFGRTRFYQASVFLFTAASMACGLATSLPQMIVFRIVQGIGGGVLTSVSQAILRESFPPEEQGMAMGVYGMGAVLAPAIGPTLGGWITDQYSWPWIFYINVPIGVLNLFLVRRYVSDPPYLVRERGYIDWAGLALLTIGLGTFQVMLERGENKDWFASPSIVALAVVALAGLVAFVVRELRVARPVVDLRLLRDRAFASATLLGGVLGMGLNASVFLLPVFLQQVLGYPAMDSGLALLPRSLAMMVLMPIGGAVYNRVGPRVLVGSGLIVSVFSFWQLSRLSADVGFWDIFFPQLWQGVGFSLVFVALSTAALTNIPRPLMTAATGLYNVVRQVCGSIGIAAAATFVTRSTTAYHAVLGSQLTALDPATSQWLAGATAAMSRAGADAVTAHQRALMMLDGLLTRQAAVLAYNRAFWIVTLVFAAGLPLVWLLRSRGHASGEVTIE
jgi:DHA2 family multidrug resistance protein